jgi:hypothetical protein
MYDCENKFAEIIELHNGPLFGYLATTFEDEENSDFVSNLLDDVIFVQKSYKFVEMFIKCVPRIPDWTYPLLLRIFEKLCVTGMTFPEHCVPDGYKVLTEITMVIGAAVVSSSNNARAPYHSIFKTCPDPFKKLTPMGISYALHISSLSPILLIKPKPTKIMSPAIAAFLSNSSNITVLVRTNLTALKGGIRRLLVSCFIANRSDNYSSVGGSKSLNVLIGIMKKHKMGIQTKSLLKKAGATKEEMDAFLGRN